MSRTLRILWSMLARALREDPPHRREPRVCFMGTLMCEKRILCVDTQGARVIHAGVSASPKPDRKTERRQAMSTIERIELYHVAIPLPAPFYPSWIPGFPQTENRFTLIRLITRDGVEGYSAGPAMGKERSGLGELLGPYLLGGDATDIALAQQRLREVAYLGWRNYWVEPAFWDIKGKMEGKPVYQLLGGEPCRISLYASTGEVKTSQERIEEAEQRHSEGFRAIKLRVHDFDESVDERHVVETARAVGDRMKIGVDANQGWRVTIVGDAPLWDLQRAKRFVDVCSDSGIEWVEEPLPMDAYDDLAALTQYSRVPVAGGELHTSGLPELRYMIERRCYDIFQPDAVFAGGIAQTFEVTRLCRRHGPHLHAPHMDQRHRVCDQPADHACQLVCG